MASLKDRLVPEIFVWWPDDDVLYALLLQDAFGHCPVLRLTNNNEGTQDSKRSMPS